MPTVLEVRDTGRTLLCFGRRLIFPNKADGTAQINNVFGRTIITTEDSEVKGIAAWVNRYLSDFNGNADQHFLWVNPHAFRILFFLGFIKPEHVEKAARRQLQDWTMEDDCFVIPAVVFAVGEKTIEVAVLVSPRNEDYLMSLVRAEIPPEGKIRVRENMDEIAWRKDN